MRTVFDKLRKSDLKLKTKKCDFFKDELHYLGYVTAGKGIYTLSEELQSIEYLPLPKTNARLVQLLL